MKSYSRKLMSIVAAVTLVGSALAGCSQSASNGGSSSPPPASSPAASSSALAEHVKLTWVMLGDPPKDFDAVKAEFNKKTNAELNAEVDFVWIGWGDLDSKYPLMLTSGQNADMIYTAAWLSYADKAKLGAFTTLTKEMLDTYAPDAVKKLPPEAWKNAAINGSIYAVPRNFLEYQDAGVAYRGDILAKAGLKTIASLDDVAKYLEAAKAAEPNIIPYNTGSNVGDFPLTQFVLKPNSLINVPGMPNLFYFNPLESKPQISSTFDNPLLLEAYPKIREMFEKGYINKNVLNNKVQSRTAFKNGQSSLATYGDNQFRDEYNEINRTHPDWKVAFQPFSAKGPYIKQSYDSGMIAIPSVSRHKERALMLMNKFFADSSYYMLMIYGIEGKHWEYTANKSMIQVPEGTDPTLYPKWQFPWGFGDWVGFNKPSVTDYPAYAEHIMEMRKQAVDNPYINFKPNTESITNEIAALNNVYTKYSGAIAYGAIDPATNLPKIMKELEAAGYTKVKNEIQKQLNAYTPEH